MWYCRNYGICNYTGHGTRVESAAEHFKLTPLSLPLSIDEHPLTVLYILDKNTLPCGLAFPGDDTMHELGLWKITTGEYQKLDDIEQGTWYVIAANEEHIFFEQLDDFNDMGMSRKAQLWDYNYSTGEFKVIFEYSQNEEGYNGALYSNCRVLYEDHLYFEDLQQNDLKQWFGKAYSYDLETEQIEFLGDNLQSPMLVNNELWFIKISDNNTAHSLYNINTGDIAKLPENVFDITSNNDDILAIYAAGENQDDGLTIFGIREVLAEEDLFTAQCYVGDIQSNDYFTVWTVYDGYPNFYSNKENKIWYLDNMDKGQHYYWIKDDFGLILTYIYNEEGNTEYKYTFFER